MILLPRERKSHRRAGLKRHLLAALLAVAGHGLFLLLMLFLSHLQLQLPPLKRPATKSQVVLRGMSSEQWAQNRGEVPATKDEQTSRQIRERKKEEPKKTPEEAPGQVVAVPPGNGETDPNAKFASETANKVAKQTRAKETDPFYKNAMQKRTSTKPAEGDGTDAVDKAQVAGNDGIGNDDRPLREGAKKPTLEVPDIQKRSELAMRTRDPSDTGANVSNRTETEAVKGNSDRLLIQPGSPGDGEEAGQGRVGQPGVANLIPSPAVLDKITGAAAPDHLEDVEEGDGTYLNTKEWKYASFFNRVKQSVSQQWNPGAQLRLRDPTGNIYGGRDRYTVLNVALTNQGNVREIYVEKSCGLDFLDLEAIQAFERAQPFPNPPPGLVQADSSVRFQFGFFLEMSGRPRMRLFRAND